MDETMPQCGPKVNIKVYFLVGLHDSLVKIWAISGIYKKYIVEIANGPNMAQTWPQYGPNKWKIKSILLYSMHDSSVKIWAILGI